MKFKYAFEMVDMGDGIIAVPVGKGAEYVHGVLRLNNAGYEIAKLLQLDTNAVRIVDSLCALYDNERSEIEQYIDKFLTVLRENDLLEE